VGKVDRVPFFKKRGHQLDVGEMVPRGGPWVEKLTIFYRYVNDTLVGGESGVNSVMNRWEGEGAVKHTQTTLMIKGRRKESWKEKQRKGGSLNLEVLQGKGAGHTK